MSADTIPNCERALPVGTLSAWRDGALSATEMQQIERHVAECGACRAHLAEYDAIAAALAAIRVPNPIGGYGHNPRVQGRTTRLTPLPTRRSRMRIASGIGALVAVLLVALAFAQVFSAFGGHGRATGNGTPASATATEPLPPVEGQPLVWQSRATLPAGIHPDPAGFAGRGGQNVSFATWSGTSAYACDVTPPPSSDVLPKHALTHVWATHDAGAQWTEVLDISAQGDATSCTVSADAFDPSMVFASSSWAFRTAPPSPNQSANYVSFDGGATWQRLPGNQLILQPATARGVTYAIHETQAGTQIGSPVSVDLAISRDGLRTWTPIDADIAHASSQQSLLRFWWSPISGALLVETEEAGTENLRLWTSADGGAHWQELSQAISLATTLGDGFFVQAPGGLPWHICAATNTLTTSSVALTCSTDGGRTWTQRPPLKLPPDQNPGIVNGPNAAYPQVIAIADDGAVLETSPNRLTGETLYRLLAGASEWESLGPVPQTSVYYSPGPGAGQLWTMPSPDSSDTSTGVYTTPYRSSGREGGG